MTATDAQLANNERYASGFSKGDLPLPPGKKVVALACMDARLDPPGRLGLEEGDAHVIRNAGGVVTDDAVPQPHDLLAPAGHQRDHPDPPHRLRDAHVQGRRREGPDRR